MKVVDSDRRQMHNFVIVNTTKGFSELINGQVELLKREKLRLSFKTIIL